MPCLVAVDLERRIGMIHAHGCVTGMDLLRANEALYSDPSWEPGFGELWDCLGINEFVVDLDEIKAIASMELEDPRVGSGQVALVMTRSVVKMIGELYQVMIQDTDRSVEIYRTLAHGAAWLGLDCVPHWLARP